MGEEKIPTRSTAQDLIEVCTDIYKYTSDLHYPYSLRHIVSSFDEKLARTMNREEYNNYCTRLKELDKFLDYYGRFIRCYKSPIRIVEQNDIHLAINHIDELSSPIKDVIKDICSEAINQFIIIVRKIGKMDSPHFDNYNTFRTKWNDIIMRYERTLSIVGLEIDMSEYMAPEAGVQAVI